MNSRSLTRFVVAAAALSLGAAAAQAATITIQATGQVANTSFGSFTVNGRDYQTGRLVLETADPLPFELNDGDVVEFEVTLDGAFVVPASQEQFFGFNLEGNDDQEAAGASNNGSITFNNASGLPTNPISVGCGNCLSALYFGGNAGAFSFDGFTGSTTITLSAPYRVDGLSISYQLSNPIPEPTTWALMIAGFGLAGAATRQRRPINKAVAHI